jgi:hypothetical protein
MNQGTRERVTNDVEKWKGRAFGVFGGRINGKGNTFSIGDVGVCV